MRIDIVTIFPEYFGAVWGVAPPGQHSGGVWGVAPPGQRSGGAGDVQHSGGSSGIGPLGTSLIGKAAARGDIEFHVHDLRRWTDDPHRSVDDAPFGGGPGMVMTPGPWGRALEAVAASGDAGPPRLIVPTPSGAPFTQTRAESYAGSPRLLFACGRYEGIDGRFVEDARSRTAVDEVSIGDYVLAGGEAATLVIVEAVCRLLPGVLGNELSTRDDSFADGLLEGPVYTRPRCWRGRDVPAVLLSGDHAAVARWRREAALLRTAANRPDLLARALSASDGGLDAADRRLLAEAGFPVRAEDVAH